MRNLHRLDKFRMDHPLGRGDSSCGAFRVAIPGLDVMIIASSGGGMGSCFRVLPGSMSDVGRNGRHQADVFQG